MYLWPIIREKKNYWLLVTEGTKLYKIFNLQYSLYTVVSKVGAVSVIELCINVWCGLICIIMFGNYDHIILCPKLYERWQSLLFQLYSTCQTSILYICCAFRFYLSPLFTDQHDFDSARWPSEAAAIFVTWMLGDGGKKEENASVCFTCSSGRWS